MGALDDVVTALAGGGVAAWAGLPPELAVSPDEAPTSLELGDDHVAAEMVHLAGSARAWTRGGAVVLVDVALDGSGDGADLDALGPADAEPVRYGLVWADERVYGERGLAAVVDRDGTAVRHLVAFVPTSAEDYRRRLRPGFATARATMRRTSAGC